MRLRGTCFESLPAAGDNPFRPLDDICAVPGVRALLYTHKLAVTVVPAVNSHAATGRAALIGTITAVRGPVKAVRAGGPAEPAISGRTKVEADPEAAPVGGAVSTAAVIIIARGP